MTYKDDQKLAPLVREISRTKNIIILERCKDDIRREFYLKATKKFGWTKDVLTNQLEGVSAYKLTEKLPRDLKKYLPSPEEMVARIQNLL